MQSYIKKSPEQGSIAEYVPIAENNLTSLFLRLLDVHQSQEKHNEVVSNNSISRVINNDDNSINSFHATSNRAVQIVNDENGIQHTGTMSYFKNIDRVEYDNGSIDVSLTDDSSVTPTLSRNTLHRFETALRRTEREFYLSTFELTSTRKSDINGISFAQSALALQLLLTALSTETENDATLQIDNLTGFNVSTEEKIECIKYVMSQLPVSSDVLKFRWSSRLVVNPRVELSDRFMTRAASALGLRLHRLTDDEAEDPSRLTNLLNDMVAEDSNGAMHDTFELEELSRGVHAALLCTIYLRAQWRTAPTLLNGTWPFYDTDDSSTSRLIGMFRVNDVVGYADLDELNAQLSMYY